MTKCYLDANVLVFLGNKSSPYYEEAINTVTHLVEQRAELYTSPLCLDEYINAALRFSNNSREKTLLQLKETLKKISSLPSIKLLNPPLDFSKNLKVLNLISKYHLRPRDAYHLLIMLENNIKIMATFDNDFETVFQKRIVKKFILPT